MCQEQDPESKVEMVWARWVEGRKRLGEEMHQDECVQNAEGAPRKTYDLRPCQLGLILPIADYYKLYEY